ncbi:MAG: restriction endonuclease [Telluria sp.]|nr:restriction endonuclease [Telluria sp.]
MKDHSLHPQQDAQRQLDALKNSVADRPALTRAAARAAASCLGDVQTQLRAVEAQIEAYDSLAAMAARLQANPAFQRILDRSMKETPDDFTMAVYEMGNQSEALDQLTAAREKRAAEAGLMFALARIEREWPDDYSQQLYEFGQQEDALEQLRKSRLGITNDPFLTQLLERAGREHPDDFSQQHYQVEQQCAARAALRRLAAGGAGVQQALAQAKTTYPDDFTLQLYEVEHATESGLTSAAAEQASTARQDADGAIATRTAHVVTTYSARGLPSYRIELCHDGLNKHRLISGRELDMVQRKAEQQARQWDQQWATTHARTSARQQTENNKALAAQLTASAAAEQERLRNLLCDSLTREPRLDWQSLQADAPFSETLPKAPLLTRFAPRHISPPVPQQADNLYRPRYGLLDWLLPARRVAKRQSCRVQFDADYWRWKELDADNARQNAVDAMRFGEAAAEAQQRHAAAVVEWETRRQAYLTEQRAANSAWDSQHAAYEAADSTAVAMYCEMVLARSPYPDAFPNECAVAFQADGGVLVVDLALPPPEAISRLKEVRYVASRDALDEKHLSDVEHAKLYDDVLYRIVLRTMSELFRADCIWAIKAVVLNGFVTALNRATGHETTACILSVRAGSDEFAAINLAQIDPKACFRQLKGIGTPKLHGLTPVAPILLLSREDRRFVASHDVAHQLDQASNLAAMDWEEFEHLIREVFAYEYAANGGEVRVTQASRDGGVDAVAFDPDPIRGGKIVIQAKRYTNTVPVSAVRDLFGTVQHEGAMKGILVTTSGFGPDALEFASNKPLSLIDGAQLLGLLAKHGHRARIDIQEARRTMALRR